MIIGAIIIGIFILALITLGLYISKECDGQEDNWESFVNETGLIRWAYIDDLLPKGYR